MQKATRKDKAFLEKVKEFLSAGRSASPREIFARMDIDITDPAFWNDGLDEIEHLLDETEQLAISMGKLPVL
jgi:oligoendopeptidase F